jgi:lipid II:glycine glycyltransferase (peptidoglycan interpeptide bridge formation enzyme)
MPEFLRMLRETEKRAGFFSHEDPYFDAIAEELLPDGVATLYFAMAEGRSVATAMVFDFGDTRYYAYGAADNTARRVIPATPLVWRTMLDARELGRTRYDVIALITEHAQLKDQPRPARNAARPTPGSWPRSSTARQRVLASEGAVPLWHSRA